MAESLGRCLLRTELVHHKNEDTMDDRKRNLKIMKNGEHSSHHNLDKKVHVSESSRRKLHQDAKRLAEKFRDIPLDKKARFISETKRKCEWARILGLSNKSHAIGI